MRNLKTQTKTMILSSILSATLIATAGSTIRPNNDNYSKKSNTNTKLENVYRRRIVEIPVNAIDLMDEKLEEYGVEINDQTATISPYKKLTKKILENKEIVDFFTEEEIANILTNITINNPELLEENDENIDIIIAEINKYIVEAKFYKVLDKYELTEDQLDIIIAICLLEAAPNYEDRHGVASTMLNRRNSILWNNYVNTVFKKEVGRNLFYQATTPGQFVVYESGGYKKWLNYTWDDAKPIVECFYTGVASHNYLAFKAGQSAGSERLAPRGNWYHNPQKESDIIREIKEEDKERILEALYSVG